MAGARTVHLVDASPYIFRAFHSLPTTLTDPAGRPVGAVYGFLGFLLRLLDEERPSHLGVAFDGSLTTSFRNEIYPDYKAQRELPPPALEAQLADCREAARALGAAIYVDSRYEADDLIGTLCLQLADAGHHVVVVSPDKDLAQLVGERVTLFDLARGRRYDRAAVVERFAVRPGQIAELLALAGDSVDNIPGVAGIGKKTAASLLGEFGDLEGLYSRLQEVDGLSIRGAAAVRSKLERGRDSAFLSRRLATIAVDAPVRADLAELELGAERARAEALFARLGFEGLRDRVLAAGVY